MDQIIQTTLQSFDFTYCLIVNVLTYVIIKVIDELNKDKVVKTWVKRMILLFSILSTGLVYWVIGEDIKLIINSAILAPVAWSWIFKPLCNKLGVDYRHINDTIHK